MFCCLNKYLLMYRVVSTSQILQNFFLGKFFFISLLMRQDFCEVIDFKVLASKDRMFLAFYFLEVGWVLLNLMISFVKNKNDCERNRNMFGSKKEKIKWESKERKRECNGRVRRKLCERTKWESEEKNKIKMGE